jgi:hypothetical protein
MAMSGDRGGAQDQGAWRARIDAEMGELKRGVNVLFGKMDDFADATNRKLDGLASSMHELRAKSGPSLRDILSTVATGAVLFGAVVSGIVYVARGGNSEKLHELELRIQRVETVLSIATAKRPPASGMAWVPEAGWR